MYDEIEDFDIDPETDDLIFEDEEFAERRKVTSDAVLGEALATAVENLPIVDTEIRQIVTILAVLSEHYSAKDEFIGRSVQEVQGGLITHLLQVKRDPLNLVRSILLEADEPSRARLLTDLNSLTDWANHHYGSRA